MFAQDDIRPGSLKVNLLLCTWPMPLRPGDSDLYFTLNHREASLIFTTVSFLRMGLSVTTLGMTVYKIARVNCCSS